MGEIIPIRPDEEVCNGLTPIHGSIHCPATENGSCYCADLTERDRIDIGNFLSTVAEIAISVAQREHGKDHAGSSLHTSE